MITFCRRSVHSFLGFSSINISDHNCDQKLPPKCYGDSSSSSSLQGLVTATGDIRRPPNVVESSSVKKVEPREIGFFIDEDGSSSSSTSSSLLRKKVNPKEIRYEDFDESSSSSSSSSLFSKKADPREIGFFINDDVDGLMSCTESLGFESSGERRIDDNRNNGNDEIELLSSKTMSSSSSLTLKWRERRLERKREEKKFPPPLSSLCQNGQPSFFLRPVRKDGRLELTEVRIDRPRVFHAYREDGRLRLHIVSHNIHDDDNNDDDEEEEEEEEEAVEEEGVVGGGGEWRFEGLSRCHQNPHNHHHHNLLGEVS